MNCIVLSTLNWCKEVSTSSAFVRRIGPAKLLVLISLWIVPLLTSCSNLMKPTITSEERLYLTPIPAETLAAYREGMPIESDLQAVIAARAYLQTTRLHSTTEPKVISVVEENLNIWKIVFEGEWLVNPPNPNQFATPPSPEHGCVYVIIDAIDQVRTEISTSPCTP
jgi:hypothetical protein